MTNFFSYGRRVRVPQIVDDLSVSGYAPEEQVLIRAAVEKIEEKVTVLFLKLKNGDITHDEYLAEINKIRAGLNLPPLS